MRGAIAAGCLELGQPVTARLTGSLDYRLRGNDNDVWKIVISEPDRAPEKLSELCGRCHDDSCPPAGHKYRFPVEDRYVLRVLMIH